MQFYKNVLKKNVRILYRIAKEQTYKAIEANKKRGPNSQNGLGVSQVRQGVRVPVSASEAQKQEDAMWGSKRVAVQPWVWGNVQIEEGGGEALV